jgi:hypothetical protein
VGSFVTLIILIWMAIKGFDSTYDWNASGFFSNVFQFFCLLVAIGAAIATLGLVGHIISGLFSKDCD